MQIILEEINEQIEIKYKQFIYTFLFLVTGVLLLNIILFYYMSVIGICLINVITIFILFPGYIITQKKEAPLKEIIHSGMGLLSITIFFDALVVGNQFPAIYLWYATFAIASYIIETLKSAFYWLVIGIALSILSVFLANILDTHTSNIFSPLQIAIVLSSNAIYFLILFFTLFYFLNEFQKLNIKQHIYIEHAENYIKVDDELKLMNNFQGEGLQNYGKRINDIPYKINDIDHEKMEELYNLIEKYFSEKKTYRNPNFNGYKLALDLNIHLSNLTKSISYKKGTNLKSLINQYRIMEVKQRLLQREHEKYTLKHIYTSVGFSSQTTFNRAFREIENMSPSEFIESLKY